MLLKFITGILFFSSSLAIASDVSISGQVATAGCVISNNKDMVFDYGNQVVGSVVSVGAILDSKYNLMIIRQCPTNTLISYLIDGEPDESNPDLFRVTNGTGQAEGIAYKISVMIPSVSSSYIPMSPKIQSAWVPTTTASTGSSNISISVKADLVTTLDKVIPGAMDATMVYNILYK